MISETLETYIETIYELEKRKKRARTKDIAEELNVKQPSVTEMFKKLEKKGFVEYQPYQGAALTRKGRNLAGELMEKHATLAQFLKTIGVEENIAEKDACRIEHIASQETIERLRSFIRSVEEQSGNPPFEEYPFSEE